MVSIFFLKHTIGFYYGEDGPRLYKGSTTEFVTKGVLRYGYTALLCEVKTELSHVTEFERI